MKAKTDDMASTVRADVTEGMWKMHNKYTKKDLGERLVKNIAALGEVQRQLEDLRVAHAQQSDRLVTEKEMVVQRDLLIDQHEKTIADLELKVQAMAAKNKALEALSKYSDLVMANSTRLATTLDNVGKGMAAMADVLHTRLPNTQHPN